MVMEETGSTRGGGGGGVTQHVNCCSDNGLWQEMPVGGSGLFAARPRALRPSNGRGEAGGGGWVGV